MCLCGLCAMELSLHPDEHHISAVTTWIVLATTQALAEVEARLDFDEDLPPLDSSALAAHIATLAATIQVAACGVAVPFK